jgi:uncharacterized membrane protein YhiD involved in acid resistance
MSTGLIVAIVIAALLVIAVMVLLPRMRANAAHKRRERELAQRREAAVETHRSIEQERLTEAERLEREAQAQKAEAQMHAQHAELHERGMADDRLVRSDESELGDHVHGGPADGRRVEHPVEGSDATRADEGPATRPDEPRHP